MAGRPKANRGSATTEVVLGQASQNLKRAVSELTVAIDTVKTLDSRGEELALQISNKENEIADLDQQFEEKERQMKLDLELKMKQNAENAVTTYLTSKGQIAVSHDEWDTLKGELTAIKTSFQENISKEKAIAFNQAKSHYDSERKLLESEHKGSQAENSAKITALMEKVAFLEEQSSQWKVQLNSEREASVKRAQANSIGTIQVGTDSRK